MKKLSYVLIGSIIGSIFTAAVVFASVGGSWIEVFYNIDDIVINGVSKMPEQKPFVYEGTTYVPLRYISENLGQEVAWEGSTRTVLIGENGEETAYYVGKDIDYMNYQEGYFSNNFGLLYDGVYKDNIGTEYNSVMTFFIEEWAMSNPWNYLEFPLNGQYDTFRGTLALTQKYKNAVDTLKLEVFNDDKLVYTQSIVAGDMPQDIEIDVKNVIKTRFKVTSTCQEDAELGLFNARFIK